MWGTLCGSEEKTLREKSSHITEELKRNQQQHYLEAFRDFMRLNMGIFHEAWKSPSAAAHVMELKTRSHPKSSWERCRPATVILETLWSGSPSRGMEGEAVEAGWSPSALIPIPHAVRSGKVGTVQPGTPDFVWICHHSYSLPRLPWQVFFNLSGFGHPHL